MRLLERVSEPVAWGTFASVWITLILSGAGDRALWIPIFELWLVLGLLSTLARRRRDSGDSADPGLRVSRALLPVHILFAIQLVPLPATLLKLLSPSSFAVHFFPRVGDAAFRPLTVSPGATTEAWLYFAGLQGLFLALQGIPVARRRSLVYGVLGVLVLLAGEGLWQSRSAHPYKLYGVVPVDLPSGFETGVFGPFMNRNHFATLTAMGAGLAAGATASLSTGGPGVGPLVSSAARLPAMILFAGISGFLAIATAASGSRSGVLAVIAAIGLVAARTLSVRALLGTVTLGVASVVLTGSATLDRLMNLDIQASRWIPWVDMSRLIRFYPLFGSGIGTFGAAYWPYQANATYEFWRYAHNDYLQWLIEGGILGVGLVGYTMVLCFRAARFTETDREMAIGATAAIGVQAFLDFPLHIPSHAAIFVCVIALTVTGRASGNTRR